MEIGKIIKNNRIAKNMTQEDLASECFVSRQLISKWENGKSYPDLEQLLKLSDFFELTLDELMRGDQIMTTTMIKNNNNKKYIIRILIGLLIILSSLIVYNFNSKVDIEFVKDTTPQSNPSEPFKREDIKEINVKNNRVLITFQTSIEGSYYGYQAGVGGRQADIYLYKKKATDVDSIKYEGTTEIDLSEFPKIKKLIVNIQ